ncbi:MAG: LuxR C-terminal-related transcriptional regulator [Chloroflexota bacterium]|nr:LuxR C-terminal-related transcriptional regulator [Chloroflexota bacterium]
MLVLLARGHDNPRIAGELFVCEGTVKNHITNIYDKLEVHSAPRPARGRGGTDSWTT